MPCRRSPPSPGGSRRRRCRARRPSPGGVLAWRARRAFRAGLARAPTWSGDLDATAGHGGNLRENTRDALERRWAALADATERSGDPVFDLVAAADLALLDLADLVE